MKIDRKALVDRNSPVLRKLEPLSPLSVGNGQFAFTADFTGLQTVSELYEAPLGTQSQWGWHSLGGPSVYTQDDLVLQQLDTHGRQVGYPLREAGRDEAYHWLRQNPHRVQLGQLGMDIEGRDGNPLPPDRYKPIEQRLDLWSGLLYSRFEADGEEVRVVTGCHPESDLLAVRIESALLQEGRIKLSLRFPNPKPTHNNWAKSIHLYWGDEQEHRTELEQISEHEAVVRRTMSEDGYTVALRSSGGRAGQAGVHEVVLEPAAGTARYELLAAFLPAGAEASFPGGRMEEVLESSKRHWEQFWSEGGALELQGSTDPRAAELERRVVLSQFLTALHCSGSIPPQETGLLYNSWYGKMHLEMHWWHAAHFPLWGRARLLANSMDWYADILPMARDLAKEQGYAGARWPKMVGPEGRQSPSPVATVLIWQQPHPIMMAEFCYLADPTRESLKRWGDVVFESAEFMASYAHWDENRRRYVLGPPLIPAQECHPAAESMNPPYELEYWKYALEIALEWKRRLGEEGPSHWAQVAAHMADYPEHEGVYLAREGLTETYTRFNRDHPSMLGAMGILPGDMADREKMRATLHKVHREWQWEHTWGWDYPMAAMTAARLGEPEMAIDMLMMDVTKNTYLPNGHNYQSYRLMAYLPGNGGLLSAVAMMACGWRNGPQTHAPGFPADGSWTVRWEGLHAWL